MNLQHLKFACRDLDQFQRLQVVLFEIGYDWGVVGREINTPAYGDIPYYLFCYGNGVLGWAMTQEYFDGHDNPEITDVEAFIAGVNPVKPARESVQLIMIDGEYYVADEVRAALQTLKTYTVS